MTSHEAQPNKPSEAAIDVAAQEYCRCRRSTVPPGAVVVGQPPFRDGPPISWLQMRFADMRHNRERQRHDREVEQRLDRAEELILYPG